MVLHYRIVSLCCLFLATFAEEHDVSQTENSEVSEYDLLAAVEIPFQDPKTQYIDEDGSNGFPALGFKSGSNVKIAHRQILPEKLPTEFSILISAKPRSRKGGFIFAVVNSYDSVVTLGVRISPEGINSTVISVFYTDSSHIASHILANFTVNKFYGKWTKFAFRLSTDAVTLFFNCNESESVPLKRESGELVFESASTLYIGQAGPIIRDFFEGALDQVKIFGDPNSAAEQCKTEKQTSVSSNIDYELEKEDVEHKDYNSNLNEGSGLEELDLVTSRSLIPVGGYYFKGKKGDRGLRGPPGESIRGPPGPPGPPGLPGPVPSEGICTCNLSSILDSLQSNNEIIGSTVSDRSTSAVDYSRISKGEKGAKGEKGERGIQGLSGSKGSKGEAGAHGRNGEPGLPGPPGPPGPIEFESIDLSWKPRGPFSKEKIISTAVVRPIVSKGETGKYSLSAGGEKGAKGEPGLKGLQGLVGPKGLPGIDGKKGDKGEKGEAGAPGPTDLTPNGAKGEKGPKGEVGEKGEPGLNGIPGEKGAPGPMGPPGPKGDQGPPGLVINSNKEELVLVKGDKGEPGRRGRRGKSGAPGLPGLPGKPAPISGISLHGWMGKENAGERKQDDIPVRNSKFLDLTEPRYGSVSSPTKSTEQEIVTHIVPGAIIFQDSEAMIKMSSASPTGTLAYVIEEEALLVKVNSGWQYIALGSVVPITTPTSTTNNPQPSSFLDISSVVNSSNISNTNQEQTLKTLKNTKG